MLDVDIRLFPHADTLQPKQIKHKAVKVNHPARPDTTLPKKHTIKHKGPGLLQKLKTTSHYKLEIKMRQSD